MRQPYQDRRALECAIVAEVERRKIEFLKRPAAPRRSWRVDLPAYDTCVCAPLSLLTDAELRDALKYVRSESDYRTPEVR